MSEENPYGEDMSPEQKRDAWATAMSLVVETVKVTHYERGTSELLAASIEASNTLFMLRNLIRHFSESALTFELRNSSSTWLEPHREKAVTTP